MSISGNIKKAEKAHDKAAARRKKAHANELVNPAIDLISPKWTEL
jgi:hypothetical protein